MNESEFINLITAHQNIIYKVCHLYMTNPVDIEDLFQEIVLQAWKSIKNFKGDSKFTTWLYKVALNTAITFYKKEQKILSVPDKTEQLIELEKNQSEKEQLRIMYKAIHQMNKVDRALIMLYLEDISYNEIGNIIGIEPGYVAVKINRVKNKLKEEVSKIYQD